MVGCGGFGAAKTGVASMVRAAAKEPAIVALAKTFFEFMGEVSFPRNTGRCGDRRHEHRGWARIYFQPDYRAQLNAGRIAAALWLILTGRRGLPVCRQPATTMEALSSKIVQLEWRLAK